MSLPLYDLKKLAAVPVQIALCVVYLIVMATVNITCNGCDYDYFRFIKNFHSENENAIEYLQAHSVLPTEVKCQKCNLPCSYRSDIHQFYYNRAVRISKKKRKRICNYTVSLYKGSFLETDRKVLKNKIKVFKCGIH